MIRTIYGRYLCPFSGFSFLVINFSLYSLILRDCAALRSSSLLSISIHKELRVLITFCVSVMIASSSSGSFARKCLSIFIYRGNSTLFGSIRTNFTSAGCFLYRIDVIIALIPTDFPCPVAPATSRCGILVRSTMYGSLVMVLPRASAISNFVS